MPVEPPPVPRARPAPPAARRWRDVLAAVVLLAFAVGCSSAGRATVAGPATAGSVTTRDPGPDPDPGTSVEPGATPGRTIEWGSCEDREAGRGERCATLTVPLDHGDPSSGTLDLALNLRPATGERVGVLLVNPGGPGASGIDFARTGPWSSELLARFDLIGFDPRGVARSTPIDCLDDAELEQMFQIPSAPETEAAVAEVVALSTEVERECSSSRIGPFLGTRNVARDMDAIREALGEEQISYYGASYGTSIGSAYLELFPERVRAMVVDSVISPTASIAEQATDQAAAFEKLLDQFVSWCRERGECPDDPRASIRAVIDRADADPIPVPSFQGRLSGALAVLGIITAFYTQDAWGYLGQALQRADQGDVSLIYQLSTFQTERAPDGSYSNLREALISVICSDAAAAERMTVDETRTLAEELARRYPTFGAAAAWGSFGCLGWPDPTDPMVPPSVDQDATVLIVGTTDDPATPYEGAVDMREAVGNSALLTYEGSGHVAYGTSSCVTAAIEQYLVDLTVPDDGTTCTR